MKVLKGYVFRLYPNVEQKILINKNIGTARLIYNIFLRDRIDTYNNTKKGKSAYDQNIMIPSLLVKYPFLKEIDSCYLRNASNDLECAYVHFFKQGDFPKLKWVKIKGYRAYTGKDENMLELRKYWELPLPVEEQERLNKLYETLK